MIHDPLVFDTSALFNFGHADHFITLAPKPRPEDLERLRGLSAVLGQGEVEVILLAREVQGMAILDDRAARRL